MNVDTGEFAALTARLGDLERQVDELAGYHRKVAVNVAALLVRAGFGAAPVQAAAPARRPRHLRAVEGGSR